MRKRLIAIGLCCGLLCFTGCTKKTQSGAENESEENTEIGGIQIQSIEIDEPATKVEPGTGEGTSSAELSNLSGSSEYMLGEHIMVSFDENQYDISIDSVSYLNSEDESNIEHIVVVDYTYENLSSDPLLVGDVRFQLTDSQQKVVYEPYYCEKLKAADVAEKGNTVTAQVAFSGVDTDDLIIVYTDIAHEDMDPILIRIDEVK